jgi:hypothetical protein
LRALPAPPPGVLAALTIAEEALLPIRRLKLLSPALPAELAEGSLGPLAKELIPKGSPPPALKPIAAAIKTGTASRTAAKIPREAMRRRHSPASVS